MSRYIGRRDQEFTSPKSVSVCRMTRFSLEASEEAAVMTPEAIDSRFSNTIKMGNLYDAFHVVFRGADTFGCIAFLSYFDGFHLFSDFDEFLGHSVPFDTFHQNERKFETSFSVILNLR